MFELCYCTGISEYKKVSHELQKEGFQAIDAAAHQVGFGVKGSHFPLFTIKDRTPQPPTLQFIVHDLEEYCQRLPRTITYERKPDKHNPHRTHNILLTVPHLGVRVSVRSTTKASESLPPPCTLHITAPSLRNTIDAWQTLGFFITDTLGGPVCQRAVMECSWSSLKLEIHQSETPTVLKLCIDENAATRDDALRSYDLPGLRLVHANRPARCPMYHPLTTHTILSITTVVIVMGVSVLLFKRSSLRRV